MHFDLLLLLLLLLIVRLYIYIYIYIGYAVSYEKSRCCVRLVIFVTIVAIMIFIGRIRSTECSHKLITTESYEGAMRSEYNAKGVIHNHSNCSSIL